MACGYSPAEAQEPCRRIWRVTTFWSGRLTLGAMLPTRTTVPPLRVASIEAATAAGDLKPGPIASANRFWFGHHVAAMVAFVFLPGRASVPYQGTPTTLVEEASWFILRGIGMRDAAIAAALVSCTQNPLELAPA